MMTQLIYFNLILIAWAILNLLMLLMAVKMHFEFKRKKNNASAKKLATTEEIDTIILTAFMENEN